MFHLSPDWLIEHCRTVELVNAIEIGDAGVLVEMAGAQPGYVLHELAHAYHRQLSADRRAAIAATYRRAMERDLYLNIRRCDGETGQAYAQTNADEDFAELTEAWFGRNDVFPFTRAELATYDPDGERLIAALWHEGEASATRVP